VEFQVDRSGRRPQLSVRDLGSTNGMRVDGHRITQTPVHDGTTVKIGNTTMSVKVVEEDT
jgi:pSer/pThr/pTyr-binding forkhead associated (FHA) protein